MALIVPSNKNDSQLDIETKKVARKILYLSKEIAENDKLEDKQWEYIFKAVKSKKWENIKSHINDSIKTYNNWNEHKTIKWTDKDAQKQLDGLKKIGAYLKAQQELIDSNNEDLLDLN